MLPEILTRRLRITPLLASDAPAMFAYRSDPEVCRYQGFEPAALDEVQDFIARLESNTFGVPGTWFQFGLRLKASGALLGDLGVRFFAHDPGQVEIGFTVAPAYQGRGFAVEAVTGMLGHLFDQAGEHRVIASVDPRNAPSLAVLRRVGMRQEAHFRESLWFKGGWADDIVYAMLASEWRGE